MVQAEGREALPSVVLELAKRLRRGVEVLQRFFAQADAFEGAALHVAVRTGELARAHRLVLLERLLVLTLVVEHAREPQARQGARRAALIDRSAVTLGRGLEALRVVLERLLRRFEAGNGIRHGGFFAHGVELGRDAFHDEVRGGALVLVSSISVDLPGDAAADREHDHPLDHVDVALQPVAGDVRRPRERVVDDLTRVEPLTGRSAARLLFRALLAALGGGLLTNPLIAIADRFGVALGAAFFALLAALG